MFTAPTAANLLANLPARVRWAAMLRGLGYSLREIGGLFGVSSQAVSILLVRHRSLVAEQQASPELQNLSRRASAALRRLGIRTRRAAVQREALKLLDGERNCGVKTRREIARWMQQTPPGEPPSLALDGSGHRGGTGCSEREFLLAQSRECLECIDC